MSVLVEGVFHCVEALLSDYLGCGGGCAVVVVVVWDEEDLLVYVGGSLSLG
jgi:hypothetical protein